MKCRRYVTPRKQKALFSVFFILLFLITITSITACDAEPGVNNNGNNNGVNNNNNNKQSSCTGIINNCNTYVNGGSSKNTQQNPAPTPTPENVSTPAQTLRAFCDAISRGDFTTADSELTPRYLNYIKTLPSNNDPYTDCTYGSLTESSTNQGLIYYYAPITFSHQSGASGDGIVDIIQTSDGNWRIDNIDCGSNFC